MNTEPSRQDQASILVVDDSRENLQLLSELLSRQGYLVRQVLEGSRAISSARAAVPDVILLDILMPGMDGYEVCRRLKADERTREIPVIFISALDETLDKIKAFSLGGVDYITKPFQEAEVLARVKTHLTIRRLFQESMKNERHRAVAQMVAGVAHELNTPLGIANTAVNLIENRVSTEAFAALVGQNSASQEIIDDIREAAHLAQSNIARAHHLMQNFKKISVGQLTDVLEVVNVVELIREIVELFSINAKRARLKIDVRETISDGDRAWSGYPGYLTQILLNLLSNIERYAYPNNTGGRIMLSIAADNERATPCFAIAIQDFGQGITPERLSHIFEPFFTTGRGQGGNGLGLAIVHNLATEALKGKIEVVSVPKQGTTFTVTFPQTITDKVPV